MTGCIRDRHTVYFYLVLVMDVLSDSLRWQGGCELFFVDDVGLVQTQGNTGRKGFWIGKRNKSA